MLALVDTIALSLCFASNRRLVAAVLKGEFPPTSIPQSLRERAARVLSEARAKQIDAIGWDDERYPPLLRAIDDAPPVLWARGSGSLALPSVAIVGSRAASPYAQQVAERLAADLAIAGLSIVSGLARGVDAAAHRGALSVGRPTVAVLGSGADIIYPPEHTAMAREIERDGLVISEFPPGSLPRPAHFPRRNRILSGLALGVVVVEAAERSGSLITAHCALQQGREVMAVPGNVLTGKHRGAHALLKDGAAVVESALDVLAALGIELPKEVGGRRVGGHRTGREGAFGEEHSGEAELNGARGHAILRLMAAGEEYELDLLAARSAIATPLLLPQLLELELAGFVHRTPGGRFVRAG